MAKVQILAVLTMDGCLSELESSGTSDTYGIEAIREKTYFKVTPEYSISMLYPTNSIPYTVVVDAEGRVTHISTGALDADTMYERYKEALGV